MGKYMLKIELLSDLCVSDGGVYNSAIDTEICYDKNGLPFIPAKRLKGCLRESALELNDWGETIEIEKIFGAPGEHERMGALSIGDAKLENFETLYKEINSADTILYHPQNVLDQFSYIRTQTSVNSETGIAEDGSLRTMRVANKGLVFCAEIKIKDVYLNNLRKACSNLTSMGIARTRGLGEVKVSVDDAKNTDDSITINVVPGATILEYEINLEEPVICKNVLGAESNTLDYIDGSKILGILADRYRSKYGAEIVELLDSDKMEFSNAYISQNGIRYTEVPGYIFKIKNNKETYINKLYDVNDAASKKNGENRQLNSMKHTYVFTENDGTLHKKDVVVEQRYHHRRPDDKSIGRAADDGSGNSMFYQISSIAAGQCFKGFIKGTNDQITKVAELLESDSKIRIGYGNSSEYGAARLSHLMEKTDVSKNISANKFIVTLLSPTIIYGANASYSTNADDLCEEVAARLGLAAGSLKICSKYVKYVSVGGYNVTWNMRKPTITTFDKGTTLIVETSDQQAITANGAMFLGERTTEGYGEFSIIPYAASEKCEFCYAKSVNGAGAKDSEHTISLSENTFAYGIANSLFKTFIKQRTANLCEGISKESYRPVVSNMLSMCTESSSFDGVKESVDARYNKSSDNKVNKKANADKIISIVDTKFDSLIKEFENTYKIKDFVQNDEDVLKHDILNALLINCKYFIRNNSQKGEA